MLYNSVYKHIQKNKQLSACDIIVALLIHRLCGNRDYIYSNLTNLAKESGYDISSISRSIKKLEEKSLIKWDRDEGKISVRESFEDVENRKDEGYVNLSTRFFDKVLDKKNNIFKQQSTAVRAALKLYYSLKIKKGEFYIGKVRNINFIKSFSSENGCCEKTIRKVLSILFSNKLFKDMKDSSSFFVIKIASTKLFEPCNCGYGNRKGKKRNTNYYRDIFLVKTFISTDDFSDNDIERTSELITQYRDKISNGELAILGIIKNFVNEYGYLSPAAIHNAIKDRINNPVIAYSI